MKRIVRRTIVSGSYPDLIICEFIFDPGFRRSIPMLVFGIVAVPKWKWKTSDAFALQK
jgi:hypothetical protein